MIDTQSPTLHRIPLVDVAGQNAALAEELAAATGEVISASQFVGGRVVSAFAEEFARFCDVAHAVPCGSGTDALQLAMLAVLGRGDGRSEIITVSHTFAATGEAIALAGYRPVFVDVDPATFLMDIDALDEAYSPRTVGVVPVHLYGQMVDIRRLCEFASRRNIAVIEDAAQAHGAKRGGVGPGQLGHAASFSFFPGKNLGAWGDAGAVVTNDQAVAARARQLANHGRSDKYTHELVGLNSRLDAIQAAVLRVKLPHLSNWNQRRKAVARRYDSLLADAGAVQRPVVVQDGEHVFHLYVIQVDDRDALEAALDRAGVASGVHYPVAVHEQPAFASYGNGPRSLANTRALCKRILSLPMCPELCQEDVRRVARAVKNFTSAPKRGLNC